MSRLSWNCVALMPADGTRADRTAKWLLFRSAGVSIFAYIPALYNLSKATSNGFVRLI